VDVAVTGSTGLIGSALVERLRQDGHRVRRVVRSSSPAGADDVRWDPAAGTIDAAALAGVEAVVHLAGAGIAEHRWTDEHKRRILDSRVQGTGLIARTMAALDPRPSVLLSGSAIGIYGDRGDEVLTEESSPGEGFLVDVVQRWEGAAQPAADAGIRVAFLRSGVVLSRSGGALAKQLPLFRFGLGGRMGSGRQWIPWIAIDDEVGAIVHLLSPSATVSGPVNLTAPTPVTNAEFTAALGRELHRPAVLPVPKFGPSLVLGRELAENLLFSSARVVPRKLEASGYSFLFPTLEQALRKEVAA
jgi:uncharacterized protein (TIGR01777 family)